MRFGSIGDLVQLTVLLEALAPSGGGVCDLVTGSAQAATVYAGLPFVGEIRRVGSRRTPYLLCPDQRALVAWLRGRGRSPVWLVETVAARRPKLRRLLARGGVLAGDLVDAGRLPRGPLEHTVDYLARLAQEAGAAVDVRPPAPLPRLALSGADEEDCREWLASRGWTGRPLVVVHPSSRRRTRGRWPAERWAALVGGILAAAPDAVAVLSATREERHEAEAIVGAAADPRVESAAGELPLRRLLALLSMAGSFVGLDSGPAHLAAAMGCPAVVLFGRADPRRVAPRGVAAVEVVASLPPERWPGDPVTWHRVNRADAISVADVAAAWRRLPPPRRRL